MECPHRTPGCGLLRASAANHARRILSAFEFRSVKGRPWLDQRRARGAEPRSRPMPHRDAGAAPAGRAAASQRRKPPRPVRSGKANVRRQRRAPGWGRPSRRAKLIGAAVVVLMLLLAALGGSAGTASRATDTPMIVTAP